MLLIVLCGLCGVAAGYAGRLVVARTTSSPERLVWWLPEVVTGLLFGLAGWRMGLSAELFLVCFVSWLAVVLSIVDIAEHRLPNVVTLPSYAVAGLWLAGVAYVRADWASLGRAALAMLVALVVFALLCAIRGMGLGDVKLAGVLGLALGWFGWPTLVAGLVLCFVYGGLISGVLMLVRIVGRRTRIPFGPFMFAGALTAFYATDVLVRLGMP
ncbi:prepilin peptidase [Fodinicola acaciae]|uniref:prepilin peptidase n=1 Tax=Fodinicola acaciae TaxID=2681555 RepID=UPI0013D21B28|nr:A24 family peptidase [Fodinicola acaciae]